MTPERWLQVTEVFHAARAQDLSARGAWLDAACGVDGRTHSDVTRDGTRLLVRQPAGPQEPGITVVMNWTDRLTRR